jgi:hypothetical protein
MRPPPARMTRNVHSSCLCRCSVHQLPVPNWHSSNCSVGLRKHSTNKIITVEWFHVDAFMRSMHTKCIQLSKCPFFRLFKLKLLDGLPWNLVWEGWKDILEVQMWIILVQQIPVVYISYKSNLIDFPKTAHRTENIGRRKVPYIEYAPNVEYRNIRESKCDNTVIKRHIDAWIKWRWSPVVLAQVSFILCWWWSKTSFFFTDNFCARSDATECAAAENGMFVCRFCK